MALVKLGATITGISGTIGGITFTRSRAGTVAKSWGRPSNPMTPWQQATRQNTSNWPQMWRDLSDSQRADWQALADDPPETDYDPFGTVRYLSGYNWFVRLNGRKLFTYQAPVEDPPAPVTPAAPDIISMSVSVPTDVVGDSYVIFGNAEFAEGEFLVWFNNFSTGPGNVTKKSNWKLVACSDAYGTSSVDASFVFAIRYGYFPPGWLSTAHIFRQTADCYRSVPTVMQSVVIP